LSLALDSSTILDHAVERGERGRRPHAPVADFEGDRMALDAPPLPAAELRIMTLTASASVIGDGLPLPA